jgi:DNA-binding transcriptional LysR family regulator
LQICNAQEPDVSEMLDLNDMYLFVKVIEHGGYSAASRALGIATSKLSRTISELERQLGVHLVNRTTRSISLSDTGETFYRHCLAMVAEAQAAREAIERTRSAPQGTVRLSCPVGLLSSNVGAILARYMADNPAVRIHLEATNRRVDVVEEGFDLAVRVRLPPLEDSELAVRALAKSRLLLVCSRWFIAQHGKPASSGDLTKLPTLSMARPGNRYVWQFIGADGTGIEVPHTPRLATDDLSTLLTAALQGIGIALLPDTAVRKSLADGSLMEVLPEVQVVPGIVHVVFPSRRGLIPAVRSLIDALVVGFESFDQ